MPFRESDPDFKDKVGEIVKKAIDEESTWLQYWISLPLLLVDEGAEFGNDIPCYEPPEETDAISAHVSVRIHAFYEHIAAAYKELKNSPAATNLQIQINPQDFDKVETKCDPSRDRSFDPVRPVCDHRRYYSRRLRLHDAEKLPDLPFITNLEIETNAHCFDGRQDKRPLSLLVPLQCLVHLPDIQDWNAPWLWEQPMPTVMANRAACKHFTWL